jgi:hypothetical protein
MPPVDNSRRGTAESGTLRGMGQLIASPTRSADFRFDWRWKEELHYCEGDHSQVFHCGWGVSPPIVFLPSQGGWDAKMPDWLHGRRAELVARIEQHSGHVVASADWAY